MGQGDVHEDARRPDAGEGIRRLQHLPGGIGVQQEGAELLPEPEIAVAVDAEGFQIEVRAREDSIRAVEIERHAPIGIAQRHEPEHRHRSAAAARGHQLGGLVDRLEQQLVADRNMARLRVQTLQRAEASARAQIGEYQNRVEAAPRVEQELASLTREYELERGQYAKLSGDHQAALVREDLERRQGGERFSVLTPANRPDAPAWPNRGRVLLISNHSGQVPVDAMVIGAATLMVAGVFWIRRLIRIEV